MDPANFRFGGGAEESQLLPLTLVLLVLASILIFSLPRRYAILPFLSACLLIPMGQVLVVGGIHLMVFRLLILAAWVRLAFAGILFKPGKAGFRLHPVDRAILWW